MNQNLERSINVTMFDQHQNVFEEDGNAKSMSSMCFLRISGLASVSLKNL